MPPGAHTPRMVLLGATLAQVAMSCVAFGLPSVSPAISEEFGLGNAALGAVLTAGLLGSGLALIAAGVLVDRVGTRTAMVAGGLLATGGLVAGAFAPGLAVLFAGLLVFGVGAAVIPVAGAGELFRVFPVERRGFALGVRQAAVPLGGIVASIGLPLLVAATDDVRAALLAIAAVVLGSSSFFAFVSSGDIAVGSQTQRQAFAEILRAPGMARLLAVAALYIVVLQAIVAFGVKAARDSGLSARDAVVVYVCVNLSAVACRVFWGRRADRDRGRKRVGTLVEIGILTTAGSVVFALALQGGVALVLPAAVFLAFGALGWNGIVYVIAGERCGPGLAGRAVSVAATVVFVLAAAAAPVAGAVADAAGWTALWLGLAVVAAGGALVARRL